MADVITQQNNLLETNDIESQSRKNYKIENGKVTFTNKTPDYYTMMKKFGYEYYPDEDSSIIFTLSDIYSRISCLDSYEPTEQTKSFVEFVKGEVEKETQIYEDNLKKGLIEFKHIGRYIKANEIMVANFEGLFDFAGKVQTIYLTSEFFTYYYIELLHYNSVGDTLQRKVTIHFIEEFKETMEISKLPLRKITESDTKTFIERYDNFSKYIFGVHYIHYKGVAFKKSMFGYYKLRENGRIMIDIQNFMIFNPNYRTNRTNDKSIKIINPDDKVKEIFYPVFYGFSFTNKGWYEFYMGNFSEIKFDKHAFDMLVMDPVRKEIAKALVMGQHQSFKDIIQGKSGGCIFLLHGQPGTGKTLTCEAMADLLERPLYIVSVGELGTNPVTLETHLKNILEISEVWNAIILFDEAEIFLQQRTNDNIKINAMTGVFLRLLEKNQGVIFLTTNRADNIDTAIRSRISVTMNYPDLNQESRETIWNNLLKFANINSDNLNLKTLSEYNLNGRQIKNAIRIAQTIAFSREKEIDMEIMKLTMEFV